MVMPKQKMFAYSLTKYVFNAFIFYVKVIFMLFFFITQYQGF